MPKLQKSKKSSTGREFVFSAEERQFLQDSGEIIKSELREKGISVEAMANELGIARSTLREIISGRSVGAE
jgi:plasmid maintenance system antidote protein VapI